MYLLAKFGDHRSYGNGDIHSYIKSYMGTLEKATLNASISHIARFLKLEILIYNSNILDTTGIKTRGRRKKQAIAKCFAIHTFAKNGDVFSTILGKKVDL